MSTTWDPNEEVLSALATNNLEYEAKAQYGLKQSGQRLQKEEAPRVLVGHFEVHLSFLLKHARKKPEFSSIQILL